MARVIDRPGINGRIVIRDSKGRPIFTGSISEASWTESRLDRQIDFDIKVEDNYNFVRIVDADSLESNASIWQRIEELEALYKSNELSYSAFCAKRRTLLGKLQGPVNPRHLEGAAAIFDESSRLPEDRVHRVTVPTDETVMRNLSLKNLLFAQLYGADPMKAWRQAETQILKSNVAGFIGSFDEVTPGGAHRKNYVFDLEDSW